MFHGVLSQFGSGIFNGDEIIKELADSAMTDKQFIATELTKWLHSPVRALQVKGHNYYHYDFKQETPTFLEKDADGTPIHPYMSNHYSIEDNIYANMVDQKANYLLGKPFILQVKNEKYEKILNFVIDKKFRRMISRAVIDCINEGIVWLYPYFNDNGELEFQSFPAHEILPFWKDSAHEVLDMAVRYYTTLAYEGRTETTVQHVEVYSLNGVERYIFTGGKLIEDNLNPSTAHFETKNEDGTATPFNWDRMPLIAFKLNPHEIPLIKRVHTLQDALNVSRSNWTDNMNKDIKDSILAVYGYGGELGSVAELRQTILKHGAILLDDGGDIKVLDIKRDASDEVAYLKNIRKTLIENARGYDAKDDRMSNNPNQMNLRSMYADIDLDADMIELQFQAAFDSLLWFIDKYLKMAGAGDFEAEEVTITFNRNIIVNDADVINNIRNSAGIVSDETLLAHHPYVQNLQEEKTRLESEHSLQNTMQQGYFDSQDKE